MADELAPKKRKTVAAGPLKPGIISLGGDQTTRTRRTAVLEWSDDDETSVAPPPNTESPSHSTCAEEQAKRGEEVPEQRARGVLAQQATGVPERRMEQRSTVEEEGPPPQDAGVDPKATAGGSGRHRRFKKLYRQTKP